MYVYMYTHTHVRTSGSHHCTHIQPHLAFSTYVYTTLMLTYVYIQWYLYTTHIDTCIHTRHTYTCTPTHIHRHAYTDTYTRTHVHRHMYTDTYTQTHVHMYTDTYVRTLSDCCWYTQSPGCTRNQFWKLLLPMHLWEHQQRKQSVPVARWEAIKRIKVTQFDLQVNKSCF